MSLPAGPRRERYLAVALHDVEPATYERCALIRDWLGDHGVDRVTLLVIPAPDLHPFNERRPEMAAWLADRHLRGDAIAQHGFQHRQSRRASRPRQAIVRLQGGSAAEFPGLDAGEAHRAVQAGRRVLKLAGLEPRGFVAPAYAYTPELRQALEGWFEWWAGLLALHRARRNGHPPADTMAPALALGAPGGLRRSLSPAVVRVGALCAGRVMRLDLHPSDFDHPRLALALERVLRRAGARRAITYDDLLSGR